MKENPLALPKPPNEELLAHEQKRKIESQVYSYKKTLVNLSEDEILNKVKEYRAKLLSDQSALKERQ
jgi:hypothetical protein